MKPRLVNIVDCIESSLVCLLYQSK